MANVLETLFVACFFAFAAAFLEGSIDQCRHGWYHFQDKCYMFSTEEETWPKAEMFCRVFGGHLAEISDAMTNEYLKGKLIRMNFADPDHHYFVGLTDEEKLNTWEWVESRNTPNFTDWGDGQPDHNNNDEHCVMLYGNDMYRWHDSDCDYAHRFICEEEEVNVNVIG